jgi:hypothetical protein
MLQKYCSLQPTRNYYYSILSMIISQVKLISKNGFASYAKHAKVT